MTLLITRLAQLPSLNVDKAVDVPQESVRKPMAALGKPSLVERVEFALRATGYLALRFIVISVDDRLVTLRGRVPSYYLKQVAQAAASKVSGVHGVRDDLNVTAIGTTASTRHRTASVSSRVDTLSPARFLCRRDTVESD